jgi:hypothetical protein
VGSARDDLHVGRKNFDRRNWMFRPGERIAPVCELPEDNNMFVTIRIKLL